MSERKRSWVHRVMLNPYFEKALIKYRQRTGFGDTYALLNVLNEYWFQEGDLTEKEYQFNKKRYSSTLIEEFERKAPIVVLNPDMVSEAEKNAQIIIDLKNAFAQWGSMREENRLYYVKKAREFPDFEISQKILNHAQAEGLLEVNPDETP